MNFQRFGNTFESFDFYLNLLIVNFVKENRKSSSMVLTVSYKCRHSMNFDFKDVNLLDIAHLRELDLFYLIFWESHKIGFYGRVDRLREPI